MPAEHFDLLEDRLGLIQLGVTGGEYMMPEERQLLFERAAGVDHTVEPVCLAAFHVYETVLVDVVAPDEVFVFQGRRRVLGVQ